MQPLLEYVFYFFYSLAKRLRGNNLVESATIYITLTLSCIIIPPSFAIVYKIFGIKYKILYYLSALVLGFTIHYFDLKIVKKRIQLLQLLDKHKNDTLIEKILGYFLVLILLTSSPVLGFFYFKLFIDPTSP